MGWQPVSPGGFHLISYTSDTEVVSFFEPEESAQTAKVTIIIGANGTGKSRLLGQIVEEFLVADEYIDRYVSGGRRPKPSEKLPPSGRLAYLLGGSVFSIARDTDRLRFYRNGLEVPPDDFTLPNKIFGIANIPVDRFRYSGRENSSFYAYQGLRQATNLTTTGALEQKVVSGLFTGYERFSDQFQIERWLKLVNLENYVEVVFRDIDVQLLETEDFPSFAQRARKIRNATVGGTRRSVPLEELYHLRVERSFHLFRALRNLSHSVPDMKGRTEIALPPSMAVRHFEDIGWTEAIEAARALRLLRKMSVQFLRDGDEIQFSDLSSGEQQVLGTIIRLQAELEPQSVVFIDEPETSLHPQWQMKYVNTLLETLSDHPLTHVVMATHSHFLVSDVDPKFANLIVAEPHEKGRFRAFDGDVYGRSPENILYRVFGVTAAGNFYVGQDLTVALQMISGTKDADLEKLTAIVQRLERVCGPDNEAMRAIVSSVNQYLAGAREENT